MPTESTGAPAAPKVVVEEFCECDAREEEERELQNAGARLAALTLKKVYRLEE